MYHWSNERKLSELSACGDDGVLELRYKNEFARVYLNHEMRDIDRVFFESDDVETTISKNDAQHVVIGEYAKHKTDVTRETTTDNLTRDVYHFLRPGGPSKTMRIGITHHRGYGTWSSLPHDFELAVEPGFEEVFFYMLSLQGSALQVARGVWHDMTPVDDLWRVRDKTFATIPMGFHPVVGEPDVRVSYVWCYLAKDPRWEKI